MIKFDKIPDVHQSLECCKRKKCGLCHYKQYNEVCKDYLIAEAEEALRLRKYQAYFLEQKALSQKAEIERLKEEKIITCSFIPVRDSRKKQFQLKMMTNAIEAIENHARREYAEKLKSRLFWSKAGEEIIDNLVEEMKNKSSLNKGE